MRLHRFIGDYDFGTTRLSVRDAGLRNQLENVLRLEAGDAVELCDGAGRDARATIAGFGKVTVDFDIEEVRQNTAEPAVDVILYCSILKRENFEIVAQKGTEAGIADLVPVLSARTVKQQTRADRLEKIMREATEQSGRGVVPALREPLRYADALDDAANGNAANVIFALGAAPYAPAPSAPGTRIGVFIGPEGGWEPEEVAAAQERGFLVAGLGARTLRAETAAAVATYLAAMSGGR
jgi:16S rRNA (uracil1498-N3)-methyltransferase